MKPPTHSLLPIIILLFGGVQPHSEPTGEQPNSPPTTPGGVGLIRLFLFYPLKGVLKRIRLLLEGYNPQPTLTGYPGPVS